MNSSNKHYAELLSELEALRISEALYKKLAFMSFDFTHTCIRYGLGQFQIEQLGGSFKAVTGHSEKEILTLGCWLPLVHEDDAQRVGLHLLNLKHGDSGEIDFRLKHTDGCIRYVREFYFCESAGNAHQLRLYGSIRDITEREQSLQSIKTSEERFSFAMEATSEGLWDWDIPSGNVYYSPGYTAMLGYATSEVPSHLNSWLDIIHPEDMEAALKANMDCIENRVDVFSVEFRMQAKNGEWRWILGRGKAVARDTSGRATRLVGTHTDITERRNVENQLRASHEMLQSILDTIPQYICWKDRQSIMLGCNINYAKMVNLTKPQDIVGMTDWDLPWKKEQTEFFLICDKRVMDTDTPEYHILEQALNASGEERWLDTSKVPLHDAEGRVNGILVAFEDVTERLRMQNLIVQTEKMMSLGGLAAGIAHEINNPLSGILQNTQLLLKRLTHENAVNTAAAHAVGCTLKSITMFMENRDILSGLERIRESSERAAHIVKSMLEFSRVSNSNMHPSDMNELIEKTIELCATDFDLKKSYDFKNITINRFFDPQLPKVFCSQTQIQQVFMNLLGNSAHATFGLSSPEITLRTVNEGQTVRIEVQDNGPGMDEITRRKIFEPFFTSKPVGDGTGLGLSISYFIISNTHKGTIEVESAVGKGTRFIIRLPHSISAIPAQNV